MFQDDFQPSSEGHGFPNIDREVSDASYHLASNLVSNIVTPQVDQYVRQIEQGQASLPPYFAVTRRTVLYRIKNMVCPFIVKQWSRVVADEQRPTPLSNPNASELYTPLLFFFIFILLKCVKYGLYNGFDVSLLYKNFSYLSLAFLCLSAVTKFILFPSLKEYSLITYVADFSCVTFHLTLTTIASFINFYLKIGIMIYCTIASLIWTLRTIRSEPCYINNIKRTTLVQNYYLLGVSAAVSSLIFLFTPVEMK